jgi:starvation-inducible outer membrane lipoprotein
MNPRESRSVSFGIFLVLLVFLSGCSTPRAVTVAEEPAIVAAKREVLEKRGWKRVEVEGVRIECNRWIIHLVRLPKTPGGHATIEVSADGKVLAYYPGL